MRTTLLRFVAVATAACIPTQVLGDDSPGWNPDGKSGCRCYQSGGWNISQTDNFRICTLSPNSKWTDLPATCEELKVQIDSSWFPSPATRSWEPRCDVIVHASLQDYQRSLGPGVGTSVGCATMQYDRGRVVSRRIDIRVDAEGWQVDALPHELTHVILADRLGNRPLPPWLDEGIGVLSESDEMRRQRADAYGEALQRDTVYSTSELMQLRTFPRPEYRDAFYVQSAALVRLLRDRAGRDKFARFADLVCTTSVDHTLRETCRIAGRDELDRIVREADPTRLVMRGVPLEKPASLVADAEE